MKRLWVLTGRVLYVLVWPGLYFYLRGTRRTRIIVNCGEDILFVKDWLGDGTWKLPGGGIRKGENLALAALRELREETGIVASTAQLGLAQELQVKGHGIPAHFYWYSLELDKKPAIRAGDIEIVDIAWMNQTDRQKQKLSKNTQQILAARSDGAF